MKIHKNEIIESKFIKYPDTNPNDAYENDDNNNKIIEIKIENKNPIRTIALPLKKRYFGSNEKNIITDNPDSFHQNNNCIIDTNDNFNFSFKNVQPENKNKKNIYYKNKINNSYSEVINHIPHPTKEINGDNILTENNINNNNNVVCANDILNKKKIKKYIVRKSNIKNRHINALMNCDMNKISPTLNDYVLLNTKNNINTINKSLTENFIKNKKEKDMKKIEEFMTKFKNKERSESLRNALNMYKRYRSLSRQDTLKLNNSCSELKTINNQIVNQKTEGNYFSNRRIINQMENNINDNISNNNPYNNRNETLINSYNKFNNSENKKAKKYFLRKIYREEKCYRDKDGNIHVVDYKQSLINEDDNPSSNLKYNLNKKVIKKDLSHQLLNIPKKSEELDNNKKINVKINQINNINSYNNINNYSEINNLNNINNIYNKKNNEINEINKNNHINIYSNNKKLRIINLTKNALANNCQNNNKKIYPEKIRLLISTSNPNNNKINKTRFYKIKKNLNLNNNNNNNNIPKNYSFQDIYYFRDNKISNLKQNNNINNPININLNNNNNINQKTINFTNKNNYINNLIKNNNYNKNNNYSQCYNNYNPYLYEDDESYPQTERPIIKRDNSNFSFYESKSLSKNKNNNNQTNNNKVCIIFERNGKYNIDYLNNNSNTNTNTNRNSKTNRNSNINNNIFYRNKNIPQNIKFHYNYNYNYNNQNERI